ncbi:nucleotidyltransferase family protein [Sphingobacterium sp. FBM7-1]|uniref:nucleotidyltransferase domain-containing protein n=1 Tax=Sphingobacterium sp. FBM7-1 TaxID=2886688 RepID=UPI001D0FA8D6|nr:nucleotidyltransferase family protein [Sphingobacterium sp. FBM7-1]MCC2600018.1 nucleotidyltransferase family protein [Sphingobacterium sp. FBM7-1]
MKDKLKETFFELLRMGLWGKGKLSVAEPLSDEDWAVLYQYALNHTVEGIIFDSFSLLSEEQLPPRALRMKWTVRVDQIERYSMQMGRVTAEQFKGFVQLGTKPILLKGQGVASCYPNPLHRISGDIDWYFEDDGYDKAREYLRKRNILADSPLGHSLGYNWQGIHIEHHRRLFDIRSLFKVAYLKKLEDTYRDKKQSVLIEGQAVSLLAPELQILQVNIHILKHLLSFGIGLRQICDAAILYHAYSKVIDSEQLRLMYKNAGILKWVHVLHAVLVKYIGLPKEDLPFPYPDNLASDWMMEEVWNSGNFGFYDERYLDGKVSFVSVHPDGARRLWINVRLYFRYAPQEVIFFPIRRAFARLTALFSRR